jgi:hypothetical protein
MAKQAKVMINNCISEFCALIMVMAGYTPSPVYVYAKHHKKKKN